MKLTWLIVIYFCSNAKQAILLMSIMLGSVLETNQYLEITIACLAQRNNEDLWWGSNTRVTEYKSGALPTSPSRTHRCP